MCSSVPDALKYFPAGRYAAPSGAYYSQEHDYLSCGECIEIQAVNCEGAPVPDRSVVVQISDSCPCGPNPKWCCGPYSVRPGFDASSSGTIHLDLSNPAFSALNSSGGNPSTSIPYGVVATQYRRVACKPLADSDMYAVMTIGQTPSSCSAYAGCESTSYISFQIANVAGAGSLWSVEIRGATATSATERTPWIPMIRNANFSPQRPQEQYGVWTGGQNNTYYFPIQFRITDSLCYSRVTREFDSAAFTCTTPKTTQSSSHHIQTKDVACFQNLYVQMPINLDLKPASMPAICSSSTSSCFEAQATRTCLIEQNCILSGMGRQDCDTGNTDTSGGWQKPIPLYAAHTRTPDARSKF